jgi:hypothetical protein
MTAGRPVAGVQHRSEQKWPMNLRKGKHPKQAPDNPP